MTDFEPIDLDLDLAAAADHATSAHPATSLTLLSLGPTPQRVWEVVAAACGLELRVVRDAAALEGLAGTDTVAVIDGVGREDALATALVEVVWGEFPIAAVGTTPVESLELVAVRAGAAAYFALPEQLEALRRWIAQRAGAARAGDRAARTRAA